MARTTLTGHWIRITPAGHVASSLPVAEVGVFQDDAHRHFTPLIDDRRREARDGWKHELISHDEWLQRAQPCLTGQCDHQEPTSA